MSEMATTQKSARLPGPILVLELLLGLLAIAAFLLLLDARRDDGNDVVSWSSTFADSPEAWALVGVLAFLLLLAIALLFVRPGASKSAPPQARAVTFERTGTPEVEWESSEGTRLFHLGCRGCGTLFEHTGRVGDNFQCPNCGREGTITAHEPVAVEVRHEACPHCQVPFDRYLEHAECPHCHQALDH